MVKISQTKVKKVDIDIKDQKILALLSGNSRMPLSEIAKSVQLSRDLVNYRIQRMIKAGLILNFMPEIDFKKLGFDIYHLFMVISDEEPKKTELIQALKNHKNTISLTEYSDRWDFEACIIAKDIYEFDKIFTELSSKFSQIITERIRMTVIESYNPIILPFQFTPEFTKLMQSKSKYIDYAYDAYDMKILEQLSKDARMSTYEISKSIPLSADAIGIRIKKLLNCGIIKKFTVHLDLSILDYNLYTFALQMKVFDKPTETKFKSFVRGHPYIVKAIKTLGAFDILIYINAENTKKFHETVKCIRNEFSFFIKNQDTYVVFKEHLLCPFPQILKKDYT